MKTILILISLGLAVGSCSYFKEKPKQTQTKQVVFVINDESASITWNTGSKQKRDQYLKQTLYTRISQPTDVVYMAIHSQSGSATNHRIISWDNESGNLDSEQQKLQVISKVLSFFETPMSAISEQQSSEIIELASEIIEFSDDFDSVSICFIGDMIQESPLRSFLRSPLSSKPEAERMGKDDAEKLCKEYGFVGVPFQKVKTIDILLPPDELSMENIQHYYHAFFKALGYKNSINWTAVR